MEQIDHWRGESPDPETAERESTALFKALAEGATDPEDGPDSNPDALRVLACLLDAVMEASSGSGP